MYQQRSQINTLWCGRTCCALQLWVWTNSATCFKIDKAKNYNIKGKKQVTEEPIIPLNWFSKIKRKGLKFKKISGRAVLGKSKLLILTKSKQWATSGGRRDWTKETSDVLGHCGTPRVQWSVCEWVLTC